MITIIKKGTKEKRTCEKCGCLFSYEADDTDIHFLWMAPVYRYIKCPQCKDEIILKYFGEDEESEE